MNKGKTIQRFIGIAFILAMLLTILPMAQLGGGVAQATVASYQDTFASLSGTRWGTDTANNGTVTVAGGKLVVDSPSTALEDWLDDDSGTGKVVTAHGDAAQSAEYKVGAGSAGFDGTGDYIDTPDHVDWTVGSGDYTIDLWVKRGDKDKDELLAAQVNSSYTSSTIAWYVYFQSDNKICFGLVSGTTYYYSTSAGTITDTTTWHHLAVVRNGNSLKLYIDGTNDGTKDVTGITANDSAFKLAIGRPGEYDGYYFNGFIDEFRFSKGIARWTSNFTPPSSAYSTDGNTKLLMHYEESVGSNNAAIAYLKEEIDQTETQLFRIKYATPSGLSIDGDRIYIPLIVNDAGGSPDVAALADVDQRVAVYVTRNAATNYDLYVVYWNSTNTPIYWNPTAVGVWTTSSTVIETLPNAAGLDEYYVNIETKDDYFRIMVVNSAYTRWCCITDWVAYSDLYAPNDDLYLCIGESFTDVYGGKVEVETFEYYYAKAHPLAFFNGQGVTAGYKYGVGRADIYQESFGIAVIPWRVPFIIESTLNYCWLSDSSSDTAQKSITTHGSATANGGTYKFGGASLILDGVGDYLSAADSADWDFGSGDFTVDFWVYRNGAQDDGDGVITAAKAAGIGWRAQFMTATGQKVALFDDIASVGAYTGNITNLTWTHLAFVRYGNTLTAYTNGVAGTPVDVTGLTFNADTTGLVIGRTYTGTDANYFTGQLDEVRVSKGIARWTTNFAVPVTAYTNDSYTKLLMHYPLPPEAKTDVAWASGVNWQGRDYIFFNGWGTKWELFYVMTENSGDTVIVQQGVALISPSGVGWRQKAINIATVLRDQNEADPAKRWKFLVTGADIGGIQSVGYFYAADPPATGNWVLTEYGANPLLNIIPDGWNEFGFSVVDFLEISGEHRLYCVGMDDDYMGHSCYYENPLEDWTTWVLNNASILQWSVNTTTEDITVNVAWGDSQVQVAAGHETHAGVAGDIVLIYDTDNNGARNHIVDLNRIKSTASGVITLERPTNRAFDSTKSARIRQANYAVLTAWGGGMAFQEVEFSPYQHAYGVCYGQFQEYANPPTSEFTVYYTGTTDLDWDYDYTQSVMIPWAPMAESAADRWMTASAENIRYTHLSSNAANYPTTRDIGTVYPGTTYNTGLSWGTLDNLSDFDINVSLCVTDITGGGYTWTPDNTGVPASNIFAINAGLVGTAYNVVVKREGSTPYNYLIEDMVGGTTTYFGFSFLAPTSWTPQYNTMTGTITFIPEAS